MGSNPPTSDDLSNKHLTHSNWIAEAYKTTLVDSDGTPIGTSQDSDGNYHLSTALIQDVNFECVGMYIARQGELITNGTSKTITGVSTTIYKYGPGVLKGIILSAVANGSIINIYDGLVVDANTLIWTSGSLPVKTTPFYMPFLDTPFSDGLTLDITTATAQYF